MYFGLWVKQEWKPKNGIGLPYPRPNLRYLKLQVLADLTPVQLTILYQDLHPIVQAQHSGSVTPSWTAAVLTEWYLVNSESGQMTGIISLAWYTGTGACIYLFLVALIRSGGKHKFNFSSIRFFFFFFLRKINFFIYKVAITYWFRNSYHYDTK